MIRWLCVFALSTASVAAAQEAPAPAEPAHEPVPVVRSVDESPVLPEPEVPVTPPETPPAQATTPVGGETAPHRGLTTQNGFALDFDGYLRVELATIQGDRFLFARWPQNEATERNPYYGRNDGFALGAARLN